MTCQSRPQIARLGAVVNRMVLLVFFVWFANVQEGTADDPVKVTQVDPSHFPEIALYVSVGDVSGQPKADLTREDFRLVEDGKPVQIKDFAGIGQNRPVDIVFVFDTTGSMSDEIEGVKNTCVAFASRLKASNRNYRLGLVTFGDEVREAHGAGGKLTAEVEEFKGWIGRQRAAGGGDGPEISLDALKRGTQMSYRDNTQKVLILITDAPPHEKGDGTTFSQVTADGLILLLSEGGYTFYAVTYSDDRYRRLAQAARGEFYQLGRNSDFIGIIDKIGGQIASQYRMTYISARPSYDGTQRAIEIEVGGKKAEGVYLEKHLINVRSSPVIAALLLLPLLAALAMPASVKAWRVRQERRGALMPECVSGTEPEVGAPNQQSSTLEMPSDVSQPTATTPTSVQIACSRCGHSLRPGAKFCGRCGHTFTAPVSARARSPEYCPVCGGPLRSGAKFCGVCGQKL